PQPLGQRDVRDLQAEPIPGALTDALEGEIRRAATQDRRVREMLGDRFVHLATDMRRFGKGQRPDPSRPLETRLLLYSYTNNVTVEVLMTGLSSLGARPVPGIQPPEAPEEIVEAIALGRAHPEISDLVQGLDAHALLLPYQDEDPGYGHRLLWVIFF